MSISTSRSVSAGIRANGQPALAAYLPDDAGACRGCGIMVLTLAGEQVATITGFPSPHLFAVFGLPARPELRKVSSAWVSIWVRLVRSGVRMREVPAHDEESHDGAIPVVRAQ